MGCPHRCVFCDQASITGHSERTLAPEQVRAQISERVDLRGKDRGKTEVAFYGGNFLGLPKSQRNILLDEAQRFVNQGDVDSIRFSTRPDTVIKEALDSLASYTVSVVEVGAQSMDDTVLSLSRRGHTAEDTRRAVGLLKERDFQVGLQIMPGLPGDTAVSILETGQRVAALHPDSVRIYPTVVVKSTVLERWYRSGQFTPLSLEDAVDLVKRLYLLFERQGISVIRMGLQTSVSLQGKGTVVAGPFHPAFGHLVHSAVFLDMALRALEAEGAESKRVTLRVHPNDVPKLRGLANENIRQLIQRFHLAGLQVLSDPRLPPNVLRVESLS